MSQGKNAARTVSNSANKTNDKAANKAASMNPSTQKEGKKSNSFLQGCLGCLGIIVLLSIAATAVALVFSALDDSPKRQEKIVTGNSQQVEDNVQAEVRQVIVDTLGETANTGEPKIINLQVNDHLGTADGNDKIVVATLHANENLTNNMTKGGILLESTNVLKKLFTIDKVQEVTLIWQLPLVDAYGNKQTEPVLKITIDKEKAAKINWSNFDRNNLKNVVNTYWEHPVLKNNK
ncbi:hypothetical protein [Effusibacillus dendaii]|uniref:Uncharacterized protein n=1 Tax=Effusibacillus dendaii TaxID=2743772 RepID=A0A7I8DC61_9BACL|nr:hypothetical protein [Effusibacillus dendaii]BCJ87674.1 hypothetical protein skT53_26590 [Effusibacillus dendaii]